MLRIHPALLASRGAFTAGWQEAASGFARFGPIQALTLHRHQLLPLCCVELMNVELAGASSCPEFTTSSRVSWLMSSSSGEQRLSIGKGLGKDRSWISDPNYYRPLRSQSGRSPLWELLEISTEQGLNSLQRGGIPVSLTRRKGWGRAKCPGWLGAGPSMGTVLDALPDREPEDVAAQQMCPLGTVFGC